MQTSSYSDPKIIQAILLGGIDKERATRHLFDTYQGYVVKGSNKYNISKEDALDAYTEAVIALIHQIGALKFRGDSKLSTYLYRIFSNKCVDVFKKNKTNKIEWVHELPDIPDMAKDILKDITTKEDFNLLLKHLDQLGQNCKDILYYSEYNGYSLEEIAKLIGFKNAQSVASMKYRCMTKLRSIISQHQDYE